MTCKNLELRVGAYVDGEISGRERDEVETHLSGCRECTRLAEDFQGLEDLVQTSGLRGSGGVPPVSGEEWARMLEVVVARGKEAPEEAPDEPTERVIPFRKAEAAGPTGIRRRLLVAAAAAAALLFGLYLGVQALKTPGHDPGDLVDPDVPTEKLEDQEKFAEVPGEPEPEIQGNREEEELPPAEGTEEPR